MVSNRGLTDYLKGFAIAAVVAGHYQKRLFPDELVVFFSSHFISFFFIMSGYGLFYSLKKLDGSRGDIREVLKTFYFQRAIRIYPLFWVKYIVDLIFDPVGGVNWGILLDIFLIRWHEPQFVWFLHALTLCYLLAPLFFYCFKNSVVKTVTISLLLFLGINVLCNWIGVPHVRTWSYMGLYFSHLLLFLFGMALPTLSADVEVGGRKAVTFALFLLVLFTFVQTSRFAFFTTNLPPYLFSITLLGVTTGFCFYFIQKPSFQPFYHFFRELGKHSFSIYLFHGFYLTILLRLNVVEQNSIMSVLIVILLFPLFILGCFLLEKCIASPLNIKEQCSNAIRDFTKCILPGNKI